MPKLVQFKDETDDLIYPKILTHFTEIISTEISTKNRCTNGYNSGSYCCHTLRNKTGDGNNMSEFYGGIYIPKIENYELLIVELNFGGSSSSAQLAGGIVLFKGTSGTYDSEYAPDWQNFILMPNTTNYVKVSASKLIPVGDRTGSYVIGSIWDTYSGNDIEWNGGYGTGGSTLRVIGIRR